MDEGSGPVGSCGAADSAIVPSGHLTILASLNASSAAVSVTPNLWPIADPSITVKALQALPVEDCPNQKNLAKSYGKWEQLTNAQKNKVFAFFSGLTFEVKTRIQTTAEAAANLAADGESSRAENTSKDDRTRLGNSTYKKHVISQLT